MECPPGMQGVSEDDALALNKCIYGLVQAARQYYKKMVRILKDIGFAGGYVDPCLFMKDYVKGLIYIALYMDENLLIGHTRAILGVIGNLREKGLVLKIEDELHDYLLCEIKYSKDGKQAWLG